MSDSSDETDFEIEIPEDLPETLPNDEYSDIEVSDDDDSDTDVSDDDSDNELSDDDSENEEADDAGEKPTTEGASRARISWTDELSSIDIPHFAKTPGPATILTKEKREFDFFSLIFPEYLWELLSDQTNLYAKQKQQQTRIEDPVWHNTTPDEMKAFIGIHMIMGMVEGLPMYKVMWATNPLLQSSAIPAIMSRTRFMKLVQYFHCNDSTLNPNRGESGHDIFHHIRRILDVVEKRCQEEYHPHRELTIDEVVIAYDDRRSKQVKLSVKIWARVDSHNGYTQRMQMYARKETRRRNLDAMNRVVSDLTTDIKHMQHHVYLCSVISSVEMLCQLEECGILAIGICHANRPGWPSDLPPKVVRKQWECKTLQCGNLVATSLYDRKQVNFLSTASDPTVDVDISDPPRRKDKKKRPIIVPQVVGMYSQFITGVHLADKLRVDLSCAKRPQKCWRYLFWFLVDTAISNAFILMSESPYHQIVTQTGKRQRRKQLNFRQNLTDQLVDKTRSARKCKVENMDCSGALHWQDEMDKKAMCQECSKKKVRCEGTMGCDQCKVNLCIDCFKPYHVAKFSAAEEDTDSD